MKIRPVGTELYLKDGRRDIMKLIIAYRNFANAPKHKKCLSHLQHISPESGYNQYAVFQNHPATEVRVEAYDCVK
jgi:hypothetical protein